MGKFFIDMYLIIYIYISPPKGDQNGLNMTLII